MNISALTKFTPVASKAFGRGSLIVRKYSPEILTTVGVVGVVTAAVFASKATLNLEPIVDNMQGHLDVANELHDTGAVSDMAHTKKKTQIITTGVMEIAKLYGPSVTLGLASIGCIVGAHGIMRKRNVALAAAYKAVESTFAKYRERVIEEFGEEKDRDYRRGVSQASVINKETNEEEIVNIVDPNGVSKYARFFDKLNDNWTKTPEYNLTFLRMHQNYANDTLHARGHLLLNDVYDMLGIPRTKEGAIVGWAISNGGDNFVDFGLYDPANEKAREFVNGHEEAILLDFNVDGVVFDLI